jgi:hypothetical protein
MPNHPLTRHPGFLRIVGAALLLGLLFGLVAGMVDAWRLHVRRAPEDAGRPERRWITAVTIAIYWAVFGGLVILTGIGPARVPFGLVWALPFALRGRRQSLHLDVQPVFGLTWSFRRAIAGALWGTLTGVALTILTVIVTRDTLNVMGLLVFTGIYTLVGASFGGVTRVVDAAASRDGGLRLTVRSARRGALLTGAIAGGLLGLLVLGVFAVASLVTPEFYLNLTRGLAQGGWRTTPPLVVLWVVLAALTLAVPVGLYFAVLGALWYGALDACQHAVLRLLLWRRGVLPLALPRLLGYGTRLVFLQRVGGGYRFVHGSLMEHIAARRDGAE